MRKAGYVAVGLHRVLRRAKKTKKFITKLGLENSSAKVFPENTVLVAMYGATAGQVGVLRLEAATNQAVCGIYPNEKLVPEYLYYALLHKQSDLIATAAGNAQPNISQIKVKNTEVPVPPLPEQKRIVAILDEAFAGIDAAIANTQKNLANAHELFESYLNAVFSQAGKGCSSIPLEKHIKFIDYRGRTPKKIESGIRLITAKNVRMGFLRREPEEFMSPDSYENWMTRGIPKKGDVLFTTEAPLGLVCQLDTDDRVAFAQRIIIKQPDREAMRPEYLSYVLRSPVVQKRIHGKATGATATGIKSSLLKKIEVPIASRSKQDEIIKLIGDIESSSKQLESIYQKKLTALAELKQSLLQKAFSGELTTGNVVPISAAKESGESLTTDSPAFAAHIMAAAYHWHESQGKNKTFGHVKAQKALHLVEALAEIDLGRAPIKDAAGPNDFDHMRAVEQWAKDNDFYQFVQRSEGQRGYDFVKGKRFGEWLPKALDAVAPYQKALDRVVGLLMPLDTKKAELVATAYAAWNNLLLDGAEPTDDAIIREARDNWHRDKQKYSKQQFRDAIDRLRSHGMVPTGTGKRVTGQNSLL